MDIDPETIARFRQEKQEWEKTKPPRDEGEPRRDEDWEGMWEVGRRDGLASAKKMAYKDLNRFAEILRKNPGSSAEGSKTHPHGLIDWMARNKFVGRLYDLMPGDYEPYLQGYACGMEEFYTNLEPHLR